MRNSAQQTTYDERLRSRVMRCGPDAVEAAVALMERQDPDSLEQALNIVPKNDENSPRCQEVVEDAWDRYFHTQEHVVGLSSMRWPRGFRSEVRDP